MPFPWPEGIELEALARRWAGRPTPWHNYSPTDAEWACTLELIWRRFRYTRAGLGERVLELRPASGAGGRVGEGAAACETRWEVFDRGDGRLILALCSDCDLTAWLEEGPDGTWRGRWVDHERCDISLTPLPEAPRAPPEWGRVPAGASDRSIVVVNLGGVLPRRFMESHQAAARRWGVGYRVLTEADLPDWDGTSLQAAAAKLLAFRFTAARAVLLLDADALVSPTAPSPWDSQGDPDEVSLVSELQDSGSLEEAERQILREWRRVGLVLGGEPPRLEPLESYCNSGFVLVGRTWQGLLEDAFVLALRSRLPKLEQTPLNYLLQRRGAPVRRLGPEWNCTDPRVLARFPMERHVYHYACLKGLMRQALG